MKQAVLILLSLLAGIISVSADAFDHPYVVAVKSDADMQLVDSVFYKIARSVVFPVNEYRIPENSGFYQELLNDVIPDLNAKGYRLESIAIRGAASPEGPYA